VAKVPKLCVPPLRAPRLQPEGGAFGKNAIAMDHGPVAFTVASSLPSSSNEGCDGPAGALLVSCML
jgi:hypothetical protein